MPVVPKFKLQYFDRSIIKTNWRRINDSPIKKGGLLVRKIARQSIRRGGKKKNPSRPGTPPRSHQKGSTPPFKMIYSVPDVFNTRVTVGMIGFGTSVDPVPGLHEHGGTATRTVFVKRRRKDQKGKQRNKSSKRRTPQQLKRIREEYARRGGQREQTEEKAIRYPQRAFMEPALSKARPRLPKLWDGSLK